MTTSQGHKMTLPRRDLPMVIVESAIVLMLMVLVTYLFLNGETWEPVALLAIAVILTVLTVWMVNDDRYDVSDALGRWVYTHRGLDESLRWHRNLDGVEWSQHALPPRLHKCRARSSWVHVSQGGDIGGIGIAVETQRCACGAVRIRGFPPTERGIWLHKNQRRATHDDHHRSPRA